MLLGSMANQHSSHDVFYQPSRSGIDWMETPSATPDMNLGLDKPLIKSCRPLMRKRGCHWPQCTEGFQTIDEGGMVAIHSPHT